MRAAHRSEKAPQPLCADRPAEFVDYDGEPPGEAEAAAMCAGCPLLEACFENARRTKPWHGVFGGVAWVAGRQAQLVEDEIRSLPQWWDDLGVVYGRQAPKAAP